MECSDDIGSRESEGNVTLTDVLGVATTMEKLMVDSSFVPINYSIEIAGDGDMQVVFSGSSELSQLTQFSFILKEENVRWILPKKGGSVCSMDYWREMYEALLADFQRISELFKGSEEVTSY